MQKTTKIQQRLIRRPGVQDRTGLARATIYQMIADGTFPHPIKIGARAVAWIEEDIDEWIDARIAEAGA